MKIYELLDSPQRWTKGAVARNNGGRIVGPFTTEACCWCLTGAIEKCYCGIGETSLDRYFEVRNKIALALDESNLPAWNDNAARKWEDIIEICKRLDV